MKKPDPKVARLMQAGVQQHQAGHLENAKAIYRQVLQRDPSNPDALHLLGVISTQQGNPAGALDLIERAIRRHPDAYSYHVNLGNAYWDLGRADDAVRCFERALAIEPRAAEAWTNLGNACERQGQPALAVERYRRALEANPSHLSALRGLGKSLAALGETAQSIDVGLRALSLAPNDEGILKELAAGFYRSSRLGDALNCTRRLTEIRPGKLEYLLQHSRFLHEAGQTAAALESAQALAAAHPGEALAHNHLGWILGNHNRFSDANAAFERAIELQPDLPQPWINRSVALWRIGKIPAAIETARHASEIAPENDEARSTWLMFLNYDAAVSPEQIRDRHLAWGRARVRAAASRARRHAALEPKPRLRVGYVSGDFRMHSVGFFIEPLLECHDRSRVEVFCYATNAVSDAKTLRLRASADAWREVHALSDDQLRDQIARDGIDVLVDLSGHTAEGRISVFALRPAPVQVSYLGYPNTTGLPTMGYRLTDAIADPEGVADTHCVERLVRLPGGFLCYRPEPDSPAVAEPALARNGHVTFGSFNVLSKISETTLSLWSGVLQGVPGSRLVVKTRGLADEEARRHVLESLARHGVEPERVTLLPPEPGHAEHLAHYGGIDIALDTTPYNGTTTTCEALWMGVPVITLRGDRHSARVGASLLHRVGLDDLVAGTPEEYIGKAAALAADTLRLRQLRAGLRERMQASPLMDAKRLASAVEDAYGKMYREAQRVSAAGESAPPLDLVLNLQGGVRVCVPDDPWALTPYVLLEQEDWFEDEIRFVRTAVEPGSHAMDIGANYGLYTMAIARATGASGSVVAFEPAARTADYLEHSLRLNGMDQVQVLRMGLSDHSGSAVLALDENPELNRVVEGAVASATAESITLVSLDDFAAQRALPEIAFMKIDAEGQEANIIAGGGRFFAGQSPLVMFEIKHGAAINQGLVDLFAARGYRSYRLVPGLNLLAAWDPAAPMDSYQLNLFGCKRDRAKLLAARGLLVEAEDLKLPQRPLEAGAWRRLLDGSAYASGLLPAWKSAAASGDRSVIRHLEALDFYAAAHNPVAPARNRLGSLLRALEILRTLALEAPSPPRLQSLARVAWEAGQRQESVQALARLMALLDTAGDDDFREPFLSACPEFEGQSPTEGIAQWCLAAAVHQLEKQRAYSSYWSEPGKTLTAAETLRDLGHLTSEMERRRQLVRLRFGLQLSPEPHPLLCSGRPDNLNPQFWNQRGQEERAAPASPSG